MSIRQYSLLIGDQLYIRILLYGDKVSTDIEHTFMSCLVKLDLITIPII